MMGDEQFELTKHDMEQMLSTTIADYSLTKLQQSAADGTSNVLEVKLTLYTGKQIHLVAKVFPRNVGTAGKLRCSLSLRKEIDVYLLVIPECRRIQEERDVHPCERLDVFCRCPAARTTRVGADDEGGMLGGEDSVLLLDDLRMQGYISGDGVAGLGLRQTELVVSRLATFHATVVAIKLTKPLVFRNVVLKVLSPGKFRHGELDEKVTMVRAALESLRQRPEWKGHLEKIQPFFSGDENQFDVKHYSPMEPFATIVHNDFRLSNMMLKYESANCAEHNIADFKIVNFSSARYGSPTSDLILFLFTSTRHGVVLEHVDSLLRLYHGAFVASLMNLKCSVQRFSFENFEKELVMFAAYELPRIVSFLVPIVNRRKTTEKFTADIPGEHNLIPYLQEDFMQTTMQTIKLFDAKGWI